MVIVWFLRGEDPRRIRSKFAHAAATGRKLAIMAGHLAAKP